MDRGGPFWPRASKRSGTSRLGGGEGMKCWCAQEEVPLGLGFYLLSDPQESAPTPEPALPQLISGLRCCPFFHTFWLGDCGQVT